MPPQYVELRCRSAFSFLDGASNPEDLVDRAAELGLGALALGDRNGVFGLPRFHGAAKRAGLRAIAGAEISTAPLAGEVDPGSLSLLVESRAGWQNLTRLITRARCDAPRDAPLAGWPEIEARTGGLIAMVRGDATLTTARLDRLRGVFGPHHVFVDVSRPFDRAHAHAARRAAEMADAFRVPVIASNDVAFARPADRRLHDALRCLHHHTTLDAAGRRLARNAERHLRAPREMVARFADRPEWIARTREIAERCRFDLDDIGYRFPVFPVADGDSEDACLRRETFAGAHRRHGVVLPARTRAQLEHELAVITRLGLAGYFLIVHDIARFARQHGMLAQGRGSAANSAVCWALGVTAVDPVAMDLLFERFLSEERGEWPDIDIDLPSGAQRERVIQYVFSKYGPHGAAMTANVVTWRTRLAVRETGKVLGLDEDVTARLAKRLQSREWDTADSERAKAVAPEPIDETLREIGVDPAHPRIRHLLDLVERVRGLPRHLGQHPGGVVIAAGRLDEVVPIEPAAMPDRRIVQWDKDDCADLGLIKIDLLGLGMLNALQKTLPLIERHEGVSVDLGRLPPDDPATYDLIQRADTVGVFQIESRAQMATLPRMKPERFYDLVVEVAIIRPGPIVGRMVNPYLERRAGRAPVTFAHPCLEPILARTLGVPLFQEQLLRIAMTAAGFSGGEAEELRRAMGARRSRDRMQRLDARLREGMSARGIAPAAQDEIVHGIRSFALYGFPESHAASFALIAYASAWLKAHHPAAFLAGLLNSQPMGFYSPATLVKDAQRHGVVVRPIDVAHSFRDCTLESDEEPSSGDGTSRGPAVRIGLRYVAGLREDAADRIAGERGRTPFRTLADLAHRAALHRDELDALAECGALAALGSARNTRRSALWQVAALGGAPGALLRDAMPAEEEDGPLDEMSAIECTSADYRATGLTVGPHWMAHLRPALARRGVWPAARLREARHGLRVRTAGHVIVRQRPEAASGFCFLTLEDETGTSNAVLTPDAFARWRAALHASSLVEIEGRVQNVDGVVHVRVAALRALDTSAELPASHDYR